MTCFGSTRWTHHCPSSMRCKGCCFLQSNCWSNSSNSSNHSARALPRSQISIQSSSPGLVCSKWGLTHSRHSWVSRPIWDKVLRKWWCKKQVVEMCQLRCNPYSTLNNSHQLALSPSKLSNSGLSRSRTCPHLLKSWPFATPTPLPETSCTHLFNKEVAICPMDQWQRSSNNLTQEKDGTRIHRSALPSSQATLKLNLQLHSLNWTIWPKPPQTMSNQQSVWSNKMRVEHPAIWVQIGYASPPNWTLSRSQGSARCPCQMRSIELRKCLKCSKLKTKNCLWSRQWLNRNLPPNLTLPSRWLAKDKSKPSKNLIWPRDALKRTKLKPWVTRSRTRSIESR